MRQKPRGYRGTGLALGVVVVLLLCLSGCAYQHPSALEMDRGRSVANNMSQQLVNPLAGLEPAPAAGLAPQAGELIMERYEKSFKEKVEPAPIIQITGK